MRRLILISAWRVLWLSFHFLRHKLREVSLHGLDDLLLLRSCWSLSFDASSSSTASKGFIRAMLLEAFVLLIAFEFILCIILLLWLIISGLMIRSGHVVLGHDLSTDCSVVDMARWELVVRCFRELLNTIWTRESYSMVGSSHLH
jgi:hypothetical protein